MDAARSSKTLVSYCNTTQYHNPENLALNPIPHSGFSMRHSKIQQVKRTLSLMEVSCKKTDSKMVLVISKLCIIFTQRDCGNPRETSVRIAYLRGKF
jgi:hypothetical protein